MHNLNGIDSKFRLAILVARRAKQLIGGARRKIEIKTDNPLTVAMEEFRQGKIDFDVLYEEHSIFGDSGMEPEAGNGDTLLTAEMVEGGTADESEDIDAEAEADADSESEETQPELEP